MKSKKERKSDYINAVALMLRMLVCIIVAGVYLFLYIDKQNQLTSLKRNIPELMAALQNLQEDNIELEYEIEQFENPLHLMELIREPQFSHLKPAFNNEVMIIDIVEADAENL